MLDFDGNVVVLDHSGVFESEHLPVDFLIVAGNYSVLGEDIVGDFDMALPGQSLHAIGFDPLFVQKVSSPHIMFNFPPE